MLRVETANTMRFYMFEEQQLNHASKALNVITWAEP